MTAQLVSTPPTHTATAPATRRVPILRSLSADLETPVSIYLKLAQQGPSFLLESVTGGEQLARYSFIGVHPRRAFVARAGEITVRDFQTGASETVAVAGDPLAALEARLANLDYAPIPGLPRFAGGLVGYLGYDAVRHFEPTVGLAVHAGLPEAIFLQTDIVVAFDHAYGKVILVGNSDPSGEDGLTPAAVEAQLDEIQARIQGPLPPAPAPAAVQASPAVSNQTRAGYHAMVERAKEYIAAGDIFQVVPSQRMTRRTPAAPFAIYRAMRRLNPSPYMFYFDFDDLAGGEPLRLIGSSPEVHVRLDARDRRALLRPIAGTRKRGEDHDADQALAAELLADPKERAEHVMLVDLGRNDLGRICRFGTVTVRDMMVVERYSHVMHIVSQVEGELAEGRNAFDLLRATFPAGTVSGAPKVRAMQIIAELEPEPRGIYAGAVGYFSYDGSLDTCIAIRTLVMRGQTVYLQSGGGVVADSDPELEYQESLNKLRAQAVAIDMAEAEVNA